jgi:hypothetical protein
LLLHLKIGFGKKRNSETGDRTRSRNLPFA